MNACVITTHPPAIDEATVSWRGEMAWPDDRHEVSFRFTCPEPGAFVPHIRPFLLSFLVPAMRLGLPIQLTAPIDQTTIHNLMEWQEAMVRWRPTQLKVVPIRGDIAPDNLPPASARAGAITAFSGGVDSCFSVHRHTTAPDDGTFRKARLKAGLMVHGFDIPESETEMFESAFHRSQRILDAFGLKAYRMQTNVRTLERVLDCDWEHETHGIWLAATLSCFEPFFDHLLIPSSYAYDILILPWGSNPATDHLFTSETTRLWHDGGAWNKLTKLKSMAHHPVIQQHLRVCWEGANLDRNCGKCYKCVATQACFWVSGVPHPACFDRPCDLKDLSQLRIKTDQDRHLVRETREEAMCNGMTAVADAVGKARRRDVIQRLKLSIKHPRQFLESL